MKTCAKCNAKLFDSCKECGICRNDIFITKPTLPFKFKQSTEDCEMFCKCGHYVNVHSNGMGGGLSTCDDCACCYCDYDYALTIALNYFQGKYKNPMISKLNADASKLWTMGGLYSGLKEPYEMVITK